MKYVLIGHRLVVFACIDQTGSLFNWEWIPRFNLIASVTLFRLNIGFEYAWGRNK